MKEVSSLMKESVWRDDKNINDCQGCNKAFSVSRRKVNTVLWYQFRLVATYNCLRAPRA
jgi:hypothetical protein